MNGRQKLLAGVAVAVAGGLISLAVAQQAAQRAAPVRKAVELPAGAKESLMKAFPGAEVRTVKREREAVMVYEAVLAVKGEAVEVSVAPDGTIVEVCRNMTAASLPKAVADTIAKESGGAALKELEQSETRAMLKVVPLDKPVVLYEASFVKDGKTVEIKVDAEGKVVARETEGGDDDDEAGEKEVTLEQVPAAVRETILKEAGKNPVKEVEQETRNGQTLYEAEWVADGQEVEVLVSADGKVLNRQVGDDDDDGDDDEEDDD